MNTERHLTVDLVPQALWGKSLHRLLSRSRWAALWTSVLDAAGRPCEICGASDRQLFCHEGWAYDDAAGLQTLVGLRATGSLCSAIHYFGNTAALMRHGTLGRDDLDTVVGHYMKVSGVTQTEFEADRRAAHDLWE